MAWSQKSKNVQPSEDEEGGPHIPPPFPLKQPLLGFSLSPNDLYVAMALCSLRKGASSEAVQHEAGSVASWVSFYVDEPPNDFAVLPGICLHVDFMKTSKIGLLAAGISHLYMQARGYRFWMHWADAPCRPIPRTKTKRVPDFIFIGASQDDWVLMESKGTWSQSASNIRHEAISGYTGQVDPYIETGAASASVSHGFALGLHVTPTAAASIAVIRSPLRVPVLGDPAEMRKVAGGVLEDAAGGPSLSNTSVVRSCYRPLLALMGLDRAVAAIDSGKTLDVAPSVIELPFGSERVLIAQSDRRPTRRSSSFGAALPAGPEAMFEGVFGIEAKIGRGIFEALTRGEGQQLQSPITPLTPEQLATFRGSPDITAMPNGLVWLPIERFESLSQAVLNYRHGGTEALLEPLETEQEKPAYAMVHG